ncbi:MAG: NADH-quinone oxidoreductase subunit J [Thermodesulfovibrionales bacterium]
MNVPFFIAGAVAVLSTLMVITRRNAVHALLYLIVSLLSVAVVLFVIGAPFVAALEVIIYAGAIMVLFVFVIMILNIGPQAARQERLWMAPETWVGPALLSAVLMVEFAYVLTTSGGSAGARIIDAGEVGVALYGPYLLGVELASILLLAGVVGAYHLGSRGHRPDSGPDHRIKPKDRNDRKGGEK